MRVLSISDGNLLLLPMQCAASFQAAYPNFISMVHSYFDFVKRSLHPLAENELVGKIALAKLKVFLIKL